MKKVKTIGIILASLLLVFVIAACDSGGGSSDDFSGTELVVGIWGGNDAETAGMEQLKTDFEAKTGATLTYRLYTDYNTQLQADLIAGTAPDVFYVDVNFFPFLDSISVLEPLDRNDVNASAFFDNLVNGFIGGSGDFYAVPKDFSTLALYVNTDMLSDVGLTTADVPGSWEDLVTWLPGFQEKLDEHYGANSVQAMTFNIDLARNLHILTRGGATVVGSDSMPTINSPGVISNFQIYMDLKHTNAVNRPQDLGSGWNGEAFGTKRTAIMDEGNWVYGYLNSEFSDVNFEVLNMPTLQGQASSMLFTVGYGLNKASNNKALGLEWIKFATGTDGMATWCKAAGVLPSRQDVADAIDVKASPSLETHLEQVQYAVPWSMGLYGNIINDQYQNFVLDAINGNISVEDAFKQVQEQSELQIGN